MKLCKPVLLFTLLIYVMPLFAQVGLVYDFDPYFYYTRFNALGATKEKKKMDFNFITEFKQITENKNLKIDKVDSVQSFSSIKLKKQLKEYCEKNNLEKLICIEGARFQNTFGGLAGSLVSVTIEEKLTKEKIYIGFTTMLKTNNYGISHALVKYYVYDFKNNEIKNINIKHLSKEERTKEDVYSNIDDITELGYNIATSNIKNSIEKNVAEIISALN